ncbi:MAG: LysE family translocator [Nitrososphaerales archaeon]
MFPSILQSLAAGIILGISIAAPPGPISAIMAHQVISKKSWSAGYAVGLGATTADAIFLLLTYLGWTGFVAHSKALIFWIYLAGGLLMVIYALMMLSKHRSSSGIAKKVEGARPRVQRLPYFIGLSMGLTNPYQIAWWLTVGIASISSFGENVVIGFFAGIIIWISLYTTGLKLGVLKFRGFEVVVLIASALVLFGFGIWFLYSALSSL